MSNFKKKYFFIWFKLFFQRIILRRSKVKLLTPLSRIAQNRWAICSSLQGNYPWISPWPGLYLKISSTLLKLCMMFHILTSYDTRPPLSLWTHLFVSCSSILKLLSLRKRYESRFAADCPISRSYYHTYAVMRSASNEIAFIRAVFLSSKEFPAIEWSRQFVD